MTVEIPHSWLLPRSSEDVSKSVHVDVGIRMNRCMKVFAESVVRAASLRRHGREVGTGGDSGRVPLRTESQSGPREKLGLPTFTGSCFGLCFVPA